MRRFPFIIGILLILIAGLARVIPVLLQVSNLLNFAPLMAIAFCGGLYLPRIWAWVVPFAALFFSDVILNLHYHASMFTPGMLAVYACYAVAVVMGNRLARDPHLPLIFGGVLANSCLFYAVTNSIAWLANPIYAKNFVGWLQALTVGDPHYAPTWTFFQHSLTSDLLYTALFVTCMHLAQAKITFQFSPDQRTSTPAA